MVGISEPGEWLILVTKQVKKNKGLKIGKMIEEDKKLCNIENMELGLPCGKGFAEHS